MTPLLLAVTLAGAEPLALVIYQGQGHGAEQARNSWLRTQARSALGDLHWAAAEIYSDPSPEHHRDWVVVAVCPHRQARALAALLTAHGQSVDLKPAGAWRQPACPALPAPPPLHIQPRGAWCEKPLQGKAALCEALWGLSCDAALARQVDVAAGPSACATLLGPQGRHLAWFQHGPLQLLACSNDEHVAWWFEGAASGWAPVAVWCDQGTHHRTHWGRPVAVGQGVCLETLRLTARDPIPALRCFMPGEGVLHAYDIALNAGGTYRVQKDVVCSQPHAWVLQDQPRPTGSTCDGAPERSLPIP